MLGLPSIASINIALKEPSRTDAKPGRTDAEPGIATPLSCCMLLCFLVVYPCDFVEMFRYTQHDNGTTAALIDESD